MATVGTKYLTLSDLAKRRDPNGRPAKIAELLEQRNEVLQALAFREGNLPTGHRTTVRVGIPTPTWVQFNEGAQPTKSATAQSDFQCAMLEDWSEVDKKLADLEEDLPAFRMSEAIPHLEGINQEWASTLIYGARTAPKEFVGLAAYYNDSTADSGQNLLKAGGSGSDNTSVYLIVTSPETIFGVSPKGSMGGIEHEDLGVETKENAGGVTGALMRVYRDHWLLKTGLCVKDWRYGVRIANIDTSDLTGGSAADLIKFMIRALHRVPSLTMGRAFFLANRTVREWLDIQAMEKTNVYLRSGEEEGVLKTRLRGVPILTCDALTNAEATVS